MKDTLIIYYSAENHTKKIAEALATNLNADLHEITLENPYTAADLDWNDEDSRVSQEYEDEILRSNIKLTQEAITINNWQNYNKIVLCYPIWYGIAAWPTNAFVKAIDWQGKIIFPVCTSHTSGAGQSAELLKSTANNQGNWQTPERIFQDASAEEIQTLAAKIA